jgi:hypothetical protein
MGWFFWQPMINESLASRARAYISLMPSAISGQHGHNATFAVAKKLVHDFGMSEADAWHIFLDYNARCQPPWNEDELRHKLHTAGNLTRAATRRGHLRHEIAKPAPPTGPAVSWTKTPAPLPKKPDAVAADMVKHSDHKEAGPGLTTATRGASIPPMITHRMEADLCNRGFSQERINKMTPTEAWEILHRSTVVATAKDGCTSLEPDPRQFETEARGIADELERLYQDGAIPTRGAQDPDACFYASLLYSFGATYSGKISNAPASTVR